MKTKLVPATTNNITKGIITFLNRKGYVAFRANNTGIFDPINNTFRKRAKNELGIPDVLACSPRGFFVGLEIKNANTKDRIRPDQKIFHDRIKGAGGKIEIVRSYDDFLKWYDLYGRWL